MAKIQLSQRMYSILDITRLLESKEMSIQPKYQRRRTEWPVSAKTALIDTILNNFPIPPIYLRDYVDSKGKRKKEIIDGQQRISTIFEFYNNKYGLANNLFDEDLHGYFFKDLPLEEQQLIEDFEVSFISIRGASDADIVSIFSRLNSFSLPLNSQEKLNSIYAGEMKTLIYELASEYNTFWVDFKIITPVNIARMADATLVSDLIFSIINGYKSSNVKLIENMNKEYDEKFTLKNEIQKNFNHTMTHLGQVLENEKILNVFKSKFMFYSLFLIFYSRLFGFVNNTTSVTGHIDLDKTIKNLENFSINYIKSDFNPELKLKFKQATGNVAQKIFRHEEISKLVI